MLQNKYLPVYHFSEKHSVVINRTAEEVFPLQDALDFSESKIIRILFFLRGMPARMMNKKGLQSDRFIELEQIKDKETIIGLIGQFWRPSGNLQKFRSEEFTSFNQTGFLKATWNFKLIPKNDSACELETETRIYCLGEKAKKKFARYWFFIRPFSGLVRKEILKSIKRKAERGARDCPQITWR